VNYNTFFHCTCGYEKALNEGEQYSILQCGTCLELTSVDKNHTCTKICQACGDEQVVTGDVTFDREEGCRSCGVKGTIGMEDLHPDALFFVHFHATYQGKCERCRQVNWTEPKEAEFPCPMCRKTLKQKMSGVWENE